MKSLGIDKFDLNNLEKAESNIFSKLNSEKNYNDAFKLCNQKFIIITKEISEKNEQKDMIIDFMKILCKENTKKYKTESVVENKNKNNNNAFKLCNQKFSDIVKEISEKNKQRNIVVKLIKKIHEKFREKFPQDIVQIQNR